MYSGGLLPAGAMPSPLFQGLSAIESDARSGLGMPPARAQSGAGFLPGNRRRRVPPSPLGAGVSGVSHVDGGTEVDELPDLVLPGGADEDGESGIALQRSVSAGADARQVKAAGRPVSSASDSSSSAAMHRRGGSAQHSDDGPSDAAGTSADESEPPSARFGAQMTPFMTPFSPLQAASGVVPALPTGDDFILDGGSASVQSSDGLGGSIGSRGAVGFIV